MDTSLFHPPAPRCALETVGASRLVLGSDHPARGPLHRRVDDIAASFTDEKDQP